MSDELAKGIHSMFKSPGPHILDPEKLACAGNISWMDVVRETDYQAEKQPDGSYIYDLCSQGISIRLSDYQHGLLLSGLPQQLVQPWSFEKDVRAERGALRLIAREISTWNQLA